MTIETDTQGNHILTADEGRAIHQRGTPSPCSTIRARLAPSLDPATWEDCELGEPTPTAPQVTRYSKLKIILAAKGRGKWDKLKEWITFANLDDEWMACQFVSSDYPEFEDIKAEVASALDMTMLEIDELLAASVDEEVATYRA